MVSALSSRLLAGRDDCTSHGSSKDNDGRLQKKRTAAGVSKTTGVNDKNESSLSGYSADREGGPRPIYPPVVSIVNLRSNTVSSTRDALKCPKRRKKKEMQYAVTTVKTDLARAGMEFKKMNKNIERSTMLGDIDINLKEHVHLVHSGELSETIASLNTGRTVPFSDYVALINAVGEFYPSNVGGLSQSHIKSFESPPAAQDVWSAQSTSSVSDTESDSGSDNADSQVLSPSPLLEDSLDSNSKAKKKITQKTGSSANTLSHVSNAITMSEILQLSETPRVVTTSSAPFPIIHANAAFHRLSGKKPNDSVVGASFFSLLDPKSNPSKDEMSLYSYTSSSSKGDNYIYLLPSIVEEKRSHKTDEEGKPVKCTISVSPILAQKTKVQEAMNVGYFAVEFIPEGNNTGTRFNKSSVAFINNPNTPLGVVA